jgi:hypothetical protein
MEDNHRFVDELLDSALTHNRATGPRPGLEGRILAHVRSASQESSKSKARKLWLASAATAVALALVAIYAANLSHNPAPQTSQTVNEVPAASPTERLKASSEPAPAAHPATKVTEPKRIARHERKPAHRVQAHHWPSQFPTPAPLSPEEKALVRYVQQTPPQVLVEPILKPDSTIQRVEVKPLEIPPLEIKPLALGPGHEEMR